MKKKQIYITELDRDRLQKLLDQRWHPDLEIYLEALRAELGRAKIVSAREIPPDVITMNSTASLIEVETSEVDVFTLVFPNDADAEDGKISVMAPLGTAMLGYRVGDVFEWDVPAGRRRWRVEKVLYQPEAAGDFHL